MNALRQQISRPSTRPDRTAGAVERTVSALPELQYEVAILDRQAGTMKRRGWSRDELQRSTGWLKRENARGRGILFRPAGTRYVLLDDLSQESVGKMRESGYAPALVLQTSKGNHQAWIRLPHAVSTDERTEVGRGLAKAFGGDPGSVDWRHLGRLPGFTHDKPEHAISLGGRQAQPFVTITDASGEIAANGEKAIAWARRRVREQQQVEEQAREAREAERSRSPGRAVSADQFAQAVAGAEQRWARQRPGQAVDRSTVDFWAVQDLLIQRAEPADIADHMAQRSPHVAGRTEAQARRYAERTVERADLSQRVMRHRGRGQRQEQDIE